MTVAILSRMPGQVMIEILTLLTIEATGVVLADTGPMHLWKWADRLSKLSGQGDEVVTQW